MMWIFTHLGEIGPNETVVETLEIAHEGLELETA